jgi:hypothetical protein
MEKHIYDAYRSDGWKLFALYVAKDGNGVKGKYSTPRGWNDMNSPSCDYDPTKIYGGVPPSDIVVVDWDTKKGKVGDKSLTKLREDLNKNLDNVVTTPSGGGHVYLRINDGVKLAKSQPRYPDIDFQCHGREWVMCGGQFIEGYGEYSFDDPIDEYFISGKITLESDGGLFELRKEFVRGNEYGGIDADEHYMTRTPKEELLEFLENLDPDMSYEGGWQQVIMALNSWDLGGDEGLEIAIEWSQKAKRYSATEDEIAEKYHMSVAEAPDFYKKIIGMVNKKDNSVFKAKINSAKSTKELEEIALEISKSKISKENRQKLADEIIEKDMGKDFYGRKRGVMWSKSVSYTPDIKTEAPDDVKLYLKGNSYVLQIGSIIEEDLNISSVKKHLMNNGYIKELERVVNATTSIGDIRHKLDYTAESIVSFSLESSEESKFNFLTVWKNPINNFYVGEIDDDIVKEFCEGVWNGKVIDIVKLIALSIKFKETKLNRLMLVAPSNTGKSEIASHLNFQKITMKRLLNALRGDKGVGADIIKGIKKTGLLLIDETNSALEQEIKDMDKEIQIDQFGSYGTQVLPLLFTILTSTHKAATRNNSDELYNRFLQIELTETEMQHSVTSGELFKADRTKYSAVIASYLRKVFIETVNGNGTQLELHELQAKYRLPTNNDLDEFLYGISEHIIVEIKNNARDNEVGDYLHRNGEYFSKRKGDVYKLALDLLSELSGIDHNKYAEKLSNFLVGDEQRVRLGDKVHRYYRLTLKPYTLDEEQQILNEFANLDIDEL